MFLESSRLALGPVLKASFPPLNPSSDLSIPPPAPPAPNTRRSLPYLSFFRESELYAGVASGARARARAGR